MIHSEWEEQKDYFFFKKLGFSEREISVAKGIIALKSNAEIAADLFITVSTVESHNKKLYAKTKTKDRTSFIKFLYENGLHRSSE